MGRIPRIIDWDKPYGESIGMGTPRTLDQDGVSYNTSGVEIIGEEDEEMPEEFIVLPPEVKLFEVPAINSSVPKIRELYEEHVGRWEDIKETGYSKRSHAVMALRRKLDELLGVGE